MTEAEAKFMKLLIEGTELPVLTNVENDRGTKFHLWVDKKGSERHAILNPDQENRESFGEALPKEILERCFRQPTLVYYHRQAFLCEKLGNEFVVFEYCSFLDDQEFVSPWSRHWRLLLKTTRLEDIRLIGTYPQDDFEIED